MLLNATLGNPRVAQFQLPAHGNFGGLFGLVLRLLSSGKLTLRRAGCASRFAGGLGDFAALRLPVVLQNVVGHLVGIAGSVPQLARIVLQGLDPGTYILRVALRLGPASPARSYIKISNDIT